MANDAKSSHEELDVLLRKLDNAERASELYSIFKSYETILNFVHEINEDYRRNTQLYYTEFGGIESDISQAEKARSQKDRNDAFRSGRNGLRSDIKALFDLIRFYEKYD